MERRLVHGEHVVLRACEQLLDEADKLSDIQQLSLCFTANATMPEELVRSIASRPRYSTAGVTLFRRPGPVQSALSSEERSGAIEAIPG
jgi:hypothetical protein